MSLDSRQGRDDVLISHVDVKLDVFPCYYWGNNLDAVRCSNRCAIYARRFD
jgi:hypothetical protein